MNLIIAIVANVSRSVDRKIEETNREILLQLEQSKKDIEQLIEKSTALKNRVDRVDSKGKFLIFFSKFF
jgi:hypothetical protein